MSAVAVENAVRPVSVTPAAAAPAHERAGPFWPFQIGGWLGYTAYALLNAYAYGKEEAYWKVVVMVASIGFLGTLVLRPVVRSLSHLPPLRFFGTALIPAFVVAAMMGATSLGGWIAVGCDDCRPKTSIGYIGWIGGHIWVVMTWIGLYFGIKNYRRLQEQMQATLSATATAHQAQLKMLRYQLNPHFLFNTLNAISTLILDRDSPTANRMVTSLSSFLRHSLDADPMQRVTLKQELDALNLYLGIEKIRFAERLTLDFDIEPEAYSALLPSLLLQPLIENAIKYAVAKRVEGGRLGIGAKRIGDRIAITVTDDGPGCPAFEQGLPQGNGVGLRNARDRLRVLYGERASFEVRNRASSGVEVTMVLPYETSGAIRD